MEEHSLLPPARSWRNHGERRTWDAQKPSELCPLKYSRHQARGVNGPVRVELQYREPSLVSTLPAFFPVGPLGLSTASTLTLSTVAGWMQAVAAGKASPCAAGIFLMEMLSCFTACTYPVDYPTAGSPRGRRQSLFHLGMQDAE